MIDLTGHMIGRYHIVTRLGTGGMATVYKAYDTRLGRYVAMKFIRTDVIEDATFVKRFDREAKTLAKLSHPNIVRILDYGDYEGNPYLVMEYISGGSLKERMGKPMPWQEALRMVIPIANALDYTHQHNIIHRDVKPSNFLISESGDPLLADFGIAKIVRLESTQITGKGGLGTPEYMAPEQGMGQPADPRTDVYSLGVVLYELITGRTPFHAPSTVAILYKHISEALPSPRMYVADLPEELEKIICKALEKRADNRYQSMADFSAAMERLLRTASTRPHPIEMPVPPQEDKSQKISGVEVEKKKAAPIPESEKAPMPPVSTPAPSQDDIETVEVRVSKPTPAVKPATPAPPSEKAPMPAVSTPASSQDDIETVEVRVSKPTPAVKPAAPAPPSEKAPMPAVSTSAPSQDDIETVEVRVSKPTPAVKPVPPAPTSEKAPMPAVSTPALSQDDLETVEVKVSKPTPAVKPATTPPAPFQQAQPSPVNARTDSAPSFSSVPEPVFRMPEATKIPDTAPKPAETESEEKKVTDRLLGLPRRTLLTCGIIAAIAACVGLILVLTGVLRMTGGTGSLEVRADAPAEIHGQQDFEIQVHVRNSGDKALTISEVTLPKSFFNGLVLTGVYPEVQQQTDAGNVIRFKFSVSLPPGEGITMRFAFRAEGAAEYSGKIEVTAGSVKASTNLSFSTVP